MQHPTGRPPRPESNPAQPRARLEWRELRALLLLVALAGAVRSAYVAGLDVSPYDPWRHLQLVRNLRAGAGLTLFEGQPYIWYNPGWHHLAAWLPPTIRLEWLAAALSTLAVVPFYLWLRLGALRASPLVAAIAGLFLATSGPVVRFTCHVGPEAFGFLLLLTGLAVAWGRASGPAALVGGLLSGVALTSRLNLLFDTVLLPGGLRERRRGWLVAGGIAAPVALVWWRNRAAITSHPFLFTWDGLATRSSDFGPLSTLLPQLHPALREALRRLHDQVVLWPEWIRDASGLRWDTILLVVLGTAAVVRTARLRLVLACAASLVYFLLLDASGSARFFRVYLGLFPIWYAALALEAGIVAASDSRRSRSFAAILIVATIAAGARQLRPAAGPPLDLVTPPGGLITEPAYAMNSGFYAPEAPLYRYPGTRFVGLPLLPEQLPEFERAFPEFRHALWQDFSIQPEIGERLAEGGVRRESVNRYGRSYRIYTLPGHEAN